MEPVIKWPGGKRFLTATLARYYEAAKPKRYIEPFAGGAALFFAIQPRNALIADINIELINLYETIRDQPGDLVRQLNSLSNSSEAYYHVRESRPRSAVNRAARTYYLQRLSFNGIYRESHSGHFNVPYGYKTSLEIADSVAIYQASDALRQAKIRCQDFRTTLQSVGEGDFIYLDPPYTVAHNRNGFIKYNSKLFSWSDQRELSELALQATTRGAIVLVSNADHRSVRLLYKDFRSRTIRRNSKIAATRIHRREVTELLLLPKAIRIAPKPRRS